MTRSQQAQPTARQPLLTVKEVAEALQVSARTIRRLIAAGGLSVVRIGSAVRVSEVALAAYLTAAAGR